MSTTSSTTSTTTAAPVTDSTQASAAAAAQRAARRRVALVWAGRLGLAAIVIGGWQAFTTWGIVDPFFFGQPSGIATRLIDLFQHGTEFGSYYANIWITIEEALIGFAAGSVAG